MTIKEYRAKFVELYEQLQDEHGFMSSVEIKTQEIEQEIETTVKITFEYACD